MHGVFVGKEILFFFCCYFNSLWLLSSVLEQIAEGFPVVSLSTEEPYIVFVGIEEVGLDNNVFLIEILSLCLFDLDESGEVAWP